MHLPPNWPISDEAFKDECNYWPIRLLKVLARFPHHFKTWLYWGHTIPNGNPPEPYSANTKLNCALLIPSILTPKDFFSLHVDNNKEVKFFAVTPIYTEEMDYKLENGHDELLALFDKEKISHLLDINRKNVCK